VEACDVLIVGAGPAGLASAACLAQRNITYTLIEAGPHVGARWRTRAIRDQTAVQRASRSSDIETH
jgi:cation diffusion facilitator CzcD-associated flavoprotein CzcO